MPRVARLRELKFKQPVPMELVTRLQAADYVRKVLDEQMPPAQFEGYQRILAYLNLLDPDTDLKELLVSSYSDAIAAWYDDEEKTFCMVGTYGASVFDEITVAHELTHALQDQHFDLEGLRVMASENDDVMLAVMALAEGDASDIMLRYHPNTSRGETGPVEDYWRFIAANMPSQSTSGMPLFIVQNMGFPYSYGTRFLQFLIEKGGPAAVDAAFRDPPVSTEQLIDPSKYLYRDEPSIIEPPDLEGAMPKPWRLVDAEQVGQFNLGILLAVHLGEAIVDEAVSGWDGDVLVGWWRPDASDCCIAYYSTWDSPAEARDFFRAARRLAEVRCADLEPLRGDDSFATWTDGERLTYLRAAGRDVLYIENIPQKHAAEVIMRLWASSKRPLGVVVPLADRDRRQPE